MSLQNRTGVLLCTESLFHQRKNRSAARPVKHAPVALGRPTFDLSAGLEKYFALLGLLLPLLQALFGFQIKQPRQRGRPSLPRQAHYFHLPDHTAIIDIDQIINVHHARRLAALAI